MAEEDANKPMTEEDSASSANKRRRPEPEIPDHLKIDGESKRRRATKRVSYAEVGATVRVGDLIVAELSSHPEGRSLIDLADAMADDPQGRWTGGRQYASVRSPLIKLLSSGRVRRKLIVPASSAAVSSPTAPQKLAYISPPVRACVSGNVTPAAATSAAAATSSWASAAAASAGGSTSPM